MSNTALDIGSIKFYDRGQPYFEFTNFAEFPFTVDGQTWLTSEHYFQAQKFVGTPYAERIRNMTRARDAFDLSRQPEASRWRRSDWEDVKVHVMHKALLAKFAQHPQLRDMLVETGNRELIEHTPNDSFWGDGGDGRGQNHLGKLLMEVRSILSKVVDDTQASKHATPNSATPTTLASSARKGNRLTHGSARGSRKQTDNQPGVRSFLSRANDTLHSKRAYQHNVTPRKLLQSRQANFCSTGQAGETQSNKLTTDICQFPALAQQSYKIAESPLQPVPIPPAPFPPFSSLCQVTNAWNKKFHFRALVVRCNSVYLMYALVFILLSLLVLLMCLVAAVPVHRDGH